MEERIDDVNKAHAMAKEGDSARHAAVLNRGEGSMEDAAAIDRMAGSREHMAALTYDIEQEAQAMDDVALEAAIAQVIQDSEIARNNLKLADNETFAKE